MAALRCWCSLVLKSWLCQSAAGEGDNDSCLEASNTNDSKSDLVENTKIERNWNQATAEREKSSSALQVSLSSSNFWDFMTWPTGQTTNASTAYTNIVTVCVSSMSVKWINSTHCLCQNTHICKLDICDITKGTDTCYLQVIKFTPSQVLALPYFCLLPNMWELPSYSFSRRLQTKS